MSDAAPYKVKPGPVPPFAEHVCDQINDRLNFGCVNALPEDNWNSSATIITWTATVNEHTATAQVRLFAKPQDLVRYYGNDATPEYVASRLLIDLSKRVGEAITGQYVH